MGKTIEEQVIEWLEEKYGTHKKGHLILPVEEIMGDIQDIFSIERKEAKQHFLKWVNIPL